MAPAVTLRGYRVLRVRVRRAVQVSEVPGQGHWWGGVVDDATMQQFYDKHLHPDAQPKLQDEFVIQAQPDSTKPSWLCVVCICGSSETVMYPSLYIS